MKKLKILSLSLLLSLAMGGCNFGKTNSSTSDSNSVGKNSTSSTLVDNGSNSSSSKKDETSSSTTSSKTPEVVTVDEGGKDVAIANPGKFYYTKDADASVSGVVEEGVSKITVSGMTTQSSVVFYYEAPNVTTGSRYELSFNFKSKAVISYVTINGTVYELEKGDNTISFRFNETDDPTLTIVMGEEGNEVVTESNEIELSTPVVTDVQYKALAPVVDGTLDEWKDTRNEENRLAVIGTEQFAGKGVTFYASLEEDGLYLAADARHSYYDDTAGAWWQCTNFEFFIGSPAVQGWVSAKADDDRKLVTEYVWEKTGDNENGWHSVVEAFVPNANIPAGAIVAGEMRLGLAWKTENGTYVDECNNGEAAGGGASAYWVPKGTWTNNADMAYVTKDGIYTESQTSFELSDFKTVTLDADLSDWEGIQGYTFTGTGDTSYKSVTWYARRTTEGLFVAAKAYHDIYITNGDAWHTSTNLEFWVNGGNQRYISANGESAGGVYGIHANKELTGDGALYETVFECVIPNAYLEGLLGEDDKVTIGFAWKTPGDVTTGGNANGGNEDAWWLAPGRDQQNPAQQFIVTETGLVDPLANNE